VNRLTGIVGVLAVLMTLGLTREAQSQEWATFVGSASCIDGEGKYVITWTLTLVLADQETAMAESPFSDTDFFDGLDLIGQPQQEGYPFEADAGNIFTSGSVRLANGPNLARTPMDTRAYNPASMTAVGRIVSSGRSAGVEAMVARPAACAA
jgi:hypothetical protein